MQQKLIKIEDCEFLISLLYQSNLIKSLSLRFGLESWFIFQFQFLF